MKVYALLIYRPHGSMTREYETIDQAYNSAVSFEAIGYTVELYDDSGREMSNQQINSLLIQAADHPHQIV